eukprot:TRINITY_DN12740_c0_g1_i1.p1 TRINITY_DN12740_c0_g1~~TRINITY_DN12740_c0_g1_i1.p1  ORF type:complete len:298 (+),score=35.54 TRINITY_DN12740_c0_g1_i1:103-996(+)
MSETTTTTIAIFGGTSRIGVELLDILLANGYPVRALLRNPDHPAIQHFKGKHPQLLEVHKGDCTRDVAGVEQVVRGADVVFICVGARSNSPGEQVTSITAQLVVDAMKRYKKRRIILVSSSALGKNAASEGFLFRFFIKRYILNNTYSDLKKAEDLLVQERDALDYTVLQLPLLTNGPLTGDYLINLTKQYPLGSATMSRKNAAHLVYTIVRDMQAHPESKFKNKFVSPTEVRSLGAFPIEDAWGYVRPQLPGLVVRFAFKVALMVVLPGYLLWKYRYDIDNQLRTFITSFRHQITI